MQSAEPRNDRTSAAIAAGALSTCTIRPATLGPATYDTARLPFSSELPATYASRSSRLAKSELYDTQKSTESVPVPNATTYICSIVSTSSA